MPEYILLGLCVAMVVCVWLSALCYKTCIDSSGFLGGVGLLVLGGVFDGLTALALIVLGGFCLYQMKATGQDLYYAFWLAGGVIVLAAALYFRHRRTKVKFHEEDLRPHQL